MSSMRKYLVAIADAANKAVNDYDLFQDEKISHDSRRAIERAISDYMEDCFPMCRADDSVIYNTTFEITNEEYQCAITDGKVEAVKMLRNRSNMPLRTCMAIINCVLKMKTRFVTMREIWENINRF